MALCLAASAAVDDEDGRGAGGEDKARGIVRWRLFHRTGVAAAIADSDPDADVGGQDPTALQAADFTGPERTPTPPNAPRLFCILGDLDQDPSWYERAWEISVRRFSRAQKSLGEHYLQQKEWERALEAYQKAVAVNRLSPELWSRLGDISLRLGRFADAADAFGRAIAAAGDVVGGEDARTWSNLGSALWSLYKEAVEEQRQRKNGEERNHETGDGGSAEEADEDDSFKPESQSRQRDPATLLAQSLAAYKRGATISHDNWRIWDNVVTLASRIRPLPVADLVLAIQSVLRIRSTEAALDADVLRLLLHEAVLSTQRDAADASVPYEPKRGTHVRRVNDLFELDIAPLITTDSALWELISRLRAWRADYAGAIDAAERGWRAAVGTAGASLGVDPSATGANWLVSREAWDVVVARTDELVSALENWGPGVGSIGDRWRSKARSAVRSVMGKAKESWEGTEGWVTLENLLEGLKK